MLGSWYYTHFTDDEMEALDKQLTQDHTGGNDRASKSNLFDSRALLLTIPYTLPPPVLHSLREHTRPCSPLSGPWFAHPEPSCHGDLGTGLGISEEIRKIVKLGWQDAGMAGGR